MKTPVPVMPAPKKPIQINTALINSLYHALLKTNMEPEELELEMALAEVGKWEWSVKQARNAYQNRVKECSNKQYSTEDQKNAGCLGSDTLDQCASKLFNLCFSPYKNLATSFQESRKSMLKEEDRLDKALKAYNVKLKMIP